MTVHGGGKRREGHGYCPVPLAYLKRFLQSPYRR
jgi:hypothetical protein